MDAPKAIWNPARDVWETESIDLLSEHSDVFSETWPTSGMTRSGLAYELQTPELPTAVSESSLLPTIGVAGGGKKIPEDAIWSGKAAYKPNGTKVQVHLDRIEMLLPTPAAMNPNDGEDFSTWEARRVATKARVQNGNGFGTPLAIAVQLLPTPTADDRRNAYGTGATRSFQSLANTAVTELVNGATTQPLSSAGKP